MQPDTPSPGPPTVLALVGPTASGKSELAVRLARRFPHPLEIVSCDAVQVYRGLDIGSGKLPPSERGGVPHHLLDVLDPEDPCTAGRYAELAAAAIREIRARGAVPLVVGGSGLYFRALRNGIFPDPTPRSPAMRQRLKRLFARPRGALWLSRLLARLDPAAHARVHPKDIVRRARALEVALLAGAPISRLQKGSRPPLPGARWAVAWLDPPREDDGLRIAARVRRMLQSGLERETGELERRHGARWRARNAIGYREIVAGLPDPEPAIVAATRRYAKRQRTWFRAEPDILRHPGRAGDVEGAILDQFLATTPRR